MKTDYLKKFLLWDPFWDFCNFSVKITTLIYRCVRYSFSITFLCICYRFLVCVRNISQFVWAISVWLNAEFFCLFRIFYVTRTWRLTTIWYLKLSSFWTASAAARPVVSDLSVSTSTKATLLLSIRLWKPWPSIVKDHVMKIRFVCLSYNCNSGKSPGLYFYSNFLQNCIASHECNGIDIIIALILNDINPLGKTRMDLVLELKVSFYRIVSSLISIEKSSKEQYFLLNKHMYPKLLWLHVYVLDPYILLYPFLESNFLPTSKKLIILLACSLEYYWNVVHGGNVVLVVWFGAVYANCTKLYFDSFLNLFVRFSLSITKHR